MRINKIRIENFKSFYEPVELNFDEIRGFWRLTGNVGSGKTSVSDAILFGLFGSVNGKNNGDLISWGRKHGKVELWCESKGDSLYIRRQLNAYGQSPTYVEVNGEELIAINKRNVQAQLENDYYDISRMSVELLCIISFNNFRSLATLNTADTKKFLDQVLGFYTLTQYIDQCKELKAVNQQVMTSIGHNIMKVQGQIDKIRELSSIQKIDGDQQEVKRKISEFTSSLTDLSNRYTDTINKIHNDLMLANQELASIKTLGTNKAKEIAFIEKGICPTCGAPIDQSQLETKKQEREVFLNQYKVIDQKIKSINTTISDIKSTYNQDRQSIQAELDTNKRHLIKLQEQAKRLSINTSEIENLNNQITDLTNTLSQHTIEDQEWELLYSILSNDVKSRILNSFIPILNSNISKYTQRLHLPYIITYDSSFTCSIEKIGINQKISLGSLSTGQMKTVNMSIILGLLSTIIGSNRLNILFLDELLSNMHKDLCDEVCAILRSNMKAGDTIFIVSHIETDNKYYDGIINVHLEKFNQFEDHSVLEVKSFGNNTWAPKQNLS